MNHQYHQHIISITVDGRTPAPGEVGSLSHYLQGFFNVLYIPGGAESLSSTVSSSLSPSNHFQQSAQINGQDFLGNTPLHLAARIGTLVELGRVKVNNTLDSRWIRPFFCPCFFDEDVFRLI